ncbi:MAG: hypothetical protein K8R60_24925 [Burkholderiales bacterium]|nr:hypothetical protein [Burkholderiales bacterium]
MGYGSDIESGSSGAELERNAYNAAFYELGFRWHWDSATYDELARRSANEAERIRHYLSARQPHLLKAYDAEFLVELIGQKQLQHRSRSAAAPARPFDWSQTLSGELGA